jgi:hypothetical protein
VVLGPVWRRFTLLLLLLSSSSRDILFWLLEGLVNEIANLFHKTVQYNLILKSCNIFILDQQSLAELSLDHLVNFISEGVHSILFKPGIHIQPFINSVEFGPFVTDRFLNTKMLL